MHFIDTHAHLYLDEFRQDIEAVVQRAEMAGVRKIILPNIDSASVKAMHRLTDRYPGSFIPLIGLHPTHVKDNYTKELEIIIARLEDFPYKAIGEIGIDLYWDKTHFEHQLYVFRRQLDYALAKNIPVVIHARESFNEIIKVIELPEYKNLRGVFHAFTGDLELASTITSMGFKLGIGGILTFKNSGLAAVVGTIGLEHLVLETDSPYLAPVPHRGKRNESSYLRLIAEKLAEIKGLPLAQVANITSRNAEELFGI